MGKKVLFTASTGAHIVNFHLPYLRRFQEEGWTVHTAFGGEPVFVPHSNETLLVPLKKSMTAPENVKATALLRRKIQTERYDLISVHTSLAAFFTRLALRGMRDRPPVVNMVHGYLFDDETQCLKRNILLTAERWTASVTDVVLTMNRWDYETAKRFELGRRIALIPGVGVDFSRFLSETADNRGSLREKLGIPENGFVLLCGAEFSKRKSQEVLIRGMRKLPEQVVLVLAGEGILRRDCRELAVRLGVEERVFFPGHVSNMPAWYAMADAAVSASRSEGLPFSIMEAMYAGLPVVASNVKGHQDLIADGETGLLYPYGAESAWAEQILRLIEEKTLSKRLGGCAREAAARYELQRVFPVVWGEYMKAISGGMAR